MKKKILCKLIALLVAAALTLTGCGFVDFGGYFRQLGNYFTGNMVTAFADMEYTRPDMDKFRAQVERVNKAVEDGSSVEALMEQVYLLNELYYNFHTNMSLANIYYCQDLESAEWSEEYSFCMENSSDVTAAIDQLYYALAKHPNRTELEKEEYFGEGFFDDYEGESLWTEEFTALMEQETALISEYYALSAAAVDEDYRTEAFYNGTGREMAELYVELIALRQQIAASAGYASYPEFAYSFYYNRDFTPEQAQVLLSGIQKELAGMYRQMDNPYGQECTEEQTFDYVKTAATAMGGKVKEAFSQMEKLGLYDIRHSEKKYNASFECYLYSYGVPFIFMNPTLEIRDKLTFAHEFGHFCNEYVSRGSRVGVDVAEFFSQGMEYLSLTYGRDTEALRERKMLDCLALFVEQSGYAMYEQRVYALEGDQLTADNVIAEFGRIGEEFGFDSRGIDSRAFVQITHFYTNPMYILSYVISNDAALQLYEMELASKGAGLALFTENLDIQVAGFGEFIQTAGLNDPFAPDRAEQIRKVIQAAIQ